jgi:hypothetical protein
VRHKVLQVAVLALLLGAPLVRNRSAAAQTPATVSVRPAALKLAPGESAALAITIDQADQLFGFELHLEFDAEVIQVVDADPGRSGVQVELAEFLGNGQGFTVANLVDNEAGSLEYAMTLLAPANPVSGTGDLLHLSVLAVAPGSSQLSLLVVLASKDGQSLAIETIGGSLLVIEDQPSAGVTAAATEASGPGLTESEVTATRPPTPSQSNTPVAGEGGADPRLALRATTAAQDSRDEPAILVTAAVLDPQAVENLEPSEEVAAAVPHATSSGETDEPHLGGDGIAAAKGLAIGEIEGNESTVEPTSEQADSNLPWLILPVVLILAAAVVIGRRLLAR